MSSIYDSKNIITRENLEVVRHRPTQYIPNIEKEGLIHAIGELLDNSFDEMNIRGKSGNLDVFILLSEKNKFQIIIIDNGRGIPHEKMIDVYTKLNTSGKFDTKSYKYSSGLFGVGAKVITALSKHFKAFSIRNNIVKSIYVKSGKFNKEDSTLSKTLYQDGVIVLLEPDNTKFLNTESYYKYMPNYIVDRIIKYTYFKDFNINVYFSSSPFPDTIYKKDNNEIIDNIYKKLQTTSKKIFTSDDFNRDEFICKYLDVNFKSVQKCYLENIIEEFPSLEYKIELFYTDTYKRYNKRFGMLNGLFIDDNNSSHFSSLIYVLKDEISHFIEDKNLVRYFKDIYTLPIAMAVNILFQGAEPTGAEKNSFYSSKFSEIYKNALTIQFQTTHKDDIKIIYENIKEDIILKYQNYTKRTSKVKSRLFESLNFPNKFTDCSTKDRSQAELFIVEGDSAGGGIKSERNGDTQAIYSLRGKPLNAFGKDNNIINIKQYMINDPMYQDLIKILNIDPDHPNTDTLHFGKIIIFCDADPDGHHISTILLGNLYLLMPEIINSGILYVSIPPYYGVKYKKSKRKKYITDKLSLIDWKIENVLIPNLEIEPKYRILTMDGFQENKIKLTNDQYKGFIHKIMDIGNLIENIANELSLDPHVLEILCHVTHYLDEKYMDINEIKKIFNMENIKFNKDTNILTISIGFEDHYIYLYNLREHFYNRLLPELEKIMFKHLSIMISEKNKERLNMNQVTIYELYMILKSIDKQFDITAYKGIGSVKPKELYENSMDENNRTVYHISNISDFEMIMKVLGKDAGFRRSLIMSER